MQDRIPFSLAGIAGAIAGALKELFPGTEAYFSPQRQVDRLPCWFVSFDPEGSAKDGIGGRELRELGVELAYLEEYGLPDAYERYARAAEILDGALGAISYGYDAPGEGQGGTERRAVPIHAHGRKWTIGPDAMRYRLRLALRVRAEEPGAAKMLSLDGIRAKEKKEAENA
jgi:hypothetical protein